MASQSLATPPQRFSSIQEVLDFYNVKYDPTKHREQPIRCPNPSHADKHPSCSLNLARQLFKCFSCDVAGGIGALVQLLSGQDARDFTRPSPSTAIKPASPNAKPHAKLEGATLKALATAKGLDVDWLRDSWGWRDANWFGTPAVLIPYCTSQGQDLPPRYRVAVRAKDRFRWEQGAKTTLYGLLNWAKIVQKGMAILVEGETDTVSLSYMGYLALGIPGASNFKDEWADFLKDLEFLYLWVEPDQIGERLAQKMQALLPQLRLIKAPSGIKDANELLQRYPDEAGFQQQMEGLLNQAEASFAMAPPAGVPQNSVVAPSGLSYGITSESASGRGRRDQGKKDRPFFLHLSTLNSHPLNIAMRERQVRLIKDARSLFSDKAEKWCNSIEKCVTSMRAQYHPVVKAIALVPMRCCERACVPCLWHNIEQFFQKRGKLLQEHFPNPAVYLIEGWHFLIHGEDDADSDGGIKDITQAETQIRKSVLRMADYEGGNLGWNTAQVFIDSIKFVLKGNDLTASIVLLVNTEINALQMLQARWEKEIGQSAQVSIVSWGNDLVGAFDEFVSRSAVNLDADGWVNYDRLARGLRRKKLFQGHGPLASMTMTRNSGKNEKSGSKSKMCEICGINHKKIEHIVSIAKAKGVVDRSPTGKVYTRALDPDNPIYKALRLEVAAEEQRQQRRAADKKLLDSIGRGHLLTNPAI